MKASSLELAARRYVEARCVVVDFGNPLGFGQDGQVWRTNINTAIKAFERLENYNAERECYQRLSAKGIARIEGLSVPALVDFDDALMIIEIDIVEPPYLLDFGKAHLDHAPDFSPEVMADWEESLVEYFGEQLPKVKRVLATLRGLGIYYLDAKPANIMLADR